MSLLYFERIPSSPSVFRMFSKPRTSKRQTISRSSFEVISKLDRSQLTNHLRLLQQLASLVEIVRGNFSSAHGERCDGPRHQMHDSIPILHNTRYAYEPLPHNSHSILFVEVVEYDHT